MVVLILKGLIKNDLNGNNTEMVKIDIELVAMIVRFGKDKSIETFNASKSIISECYQRNKAVLLFVGL